MGWLLRGGWRGGKIHRRRRGLRMSMAGKLNFRSWADGMCNRGDRGIEGTEDKSGKQIFNGLVISLLGRNPVCRWEGARKLVLPVVDHCSQLLRNLNVKAISVSLHSEGWRS